MTSDKPIRSDDQREAYPTVEIAALDNLWFQVSGTLCNIRCSHCFISAGPTNRTFGFMNYEEVVRLLEESSTLGVKEYYFTGGEPFMNRELPKMLAKTLEYGPATVLTNAMLIDDGVARLLSEIERSFLYSLELRVSLDGYDEKMNDDIRGTGVFEKTLAGLSRLVEHGLLPIVTVTKTWEDNRDAEVLNDFVATLKARGYSRPRIKVLPTIKLGKEVERTGGYGKYEYVTREMLAGYDTENLICSNSRVATDKGIYVCPILLDSPDAMLGRSLAESLKGYALSHQACYTCYLYGAICSNPSDMSRDV